MGNFIDMTGEEIGQLTVVRMADERSPGGQIKWLCKCSCGNECAYTRSNLKSGKIKSCGCWQKYRLRRGYRFSPPGETYSYGLDLDESLGE